MKKHLFYFGLILLFSPSVFAQKSKKIKLAQFEKMLADGSDSLTVINFWATWCKPCVKEIPGFEATRLKMKDKPVRFWYISLDFADDQKTRLEPFMKAKMKGASVFLLDETNYDKWLPKVEPNWQGAIPVTLFVNNSKKIKKFEDKELTELQLNEIISSLL